MRLFLLIYDRCVVKLFYYVRLLIRCTVVYLGHARKIFFLEKIISFARHIISCARHINSYARHIISCARHNMLEVCEILLDFYVATDVYSGGDIYFIRMFTSMKV